MGYEAELHSQAGRPRLHRGVSECRPTPKLSQSDGRPWAPLPAISQAVHELQAHTTRRVSAKPAAWQPRSMPCRLTIWPTTPLGLLWYPSDEPMMSVDTDLAALLAMSGLVAVVDEQHRIIRGQV